MPTPPDVIIVGAGIIGSSIAWRLSQRGLSVALLDAGTMGGEASTAGAGMLAPGGEMMVRSTWSMRAVESLRSYPGFVAELREVSGVSIDYQACGAVELAATPDEWEQLLSRSRVQDELQIRPHPISSAEVATLIPGVNPRSFTSALFHPDDAYVDPTQVIQALQSVCARREHCRVQGIDPESTAVVLDGERLSAGAIVVAAGAWSGALLSGVPDSFPVKGHLVGYPLTPGSLPVMIRHGHTYALQRANGFTIAGSTSENAGFDRTVDPQTVQEIHRRASHYLPGLLQEPPSVAWIGFRPATSAPDPVVRRLEGTHVWLAYGHYRNGILLAPVTAKLVADEIFGR